MLSGLWIYALYSTLEVDLRASLLDLYLVFFLMWNCEDKYWRRAKAWAVLEISISLSVSIQKNLWPSVPQDLQISSVAAYYWETDGSNLKPDSFSFILIGQWRNISNKASPWLRGMELAGGAFWCCWHPLPPYETAVNQGRLYCNSARWALVRCTPLSSPECLQRWTPY